MDPKRPLYVKGESESESESDSGSYVVVYDPPRLKLREEAGGAKLRVGSFDGPLVGAVAVAVAVVIATATAIAVAVAIAIAVHLSVTNTYILRRSQVLL